MRPLVMMLLVLSSPLFADEKQTAKAAAREGERLMDVGEYQAALEALKRAYVAGEDVRLLYDIAECHRLLNHKVEAIQTYRTYLRKNPSADNTAEVEAWIAQLGGQPAKAEAPAKTEAPQHPAPVAAVNPPRPRIVVMPSPAPVGAVYNPWGRPVMAPAPVATAPTPPRNKPAEAPPAKPKEPAKKPAPARSWTDF